MAAPFYRSYPELSRLARVVAGRLFSRPFRHRLLELGEVPAAPPGETRAYPEGVDPHSHARLGGKRRSLSLLGPGPGLPCPGGPSVPGCRCAPKKGGVGRGGGGPSTGEPRFPVAPSPSGGANPGGGAARPPDPLEPELVLPLFLLKLRRVAVGQFLLIRRTEYERMGGHGAVRAEVLEDQALAERAVKSGLRKKLLFAGDLARCRMYRRFGAANRGLAPPGFPWPTPSCTWWPRAPPPARPSGTFLDGAPGRAAPFL